ncbi:MAG TPA: PAS domain S-box protein [Clostridia bacterium]|nr:PAS domain S-box protein [Clostridia bacterium]
MTNDDYFQLSQDELVRRLRALEARTGKRTGAPVGSINEDAQRLQAILQSAVEGIITIDERGIVDSFNPAAEAIFGYTAQEIIGKNLSLLMPSPDRETHDQYIAEYLRTQAKVIGGGREATGRRKDGTLFAMELAVSEVRLPDRRLFAGYVRDISERRKAEERLTLIQSVVDQGFSAVLITDSDLPDPRVLYINPAFAQATGHQADVVGQRLSKLESLQRVRQGLASGMTQAERFVEQVSTFPTAQGERWGEWRVGPVKDKEGRITHWLVIFRDITERKRLEREILQISDRERQRIGQDLHDGLSQHLVGIELMSQVLEQKLAARHKTAAGQVGEIAKHVREAITQARALARGLAPVTLESEGLGSALQELAHTAESLFSIRCRFECEMAAPVRDSRLAIQLYRIAQEAVSNAVKHGKAREVVIRLLTDRDRLVLQVRDYGLGFPKELPSNRGMGLRIMQYRAGILAGVLVFENPPEGGGMVVCSVPIHEINR